jgi:hypothetical protein
MAVRCRVPLSTRAISIDRWTELRQRLRHQASETIPGAALKAPSTAAAAFEGGFAAHALRRSASPAAAAASSHRIGSAGLAS